MPLETFTDAAGLSFRQYSRAGNLVILRGSRNQRNAESYIVAHVVTDESGKESLGESYACNTSPEAMHRFQTELLKIRTAENNQPAEV